MGYCGCLLWLIIALVVWKLIYNFTIMLLFIPLGLVAVIFGGYLFRESRMAGALLVLAGVAMIVLSIINRDLSIGVMIDSIPYWLGIMDKN